jgi:hypothetical protein
MAFKSGYFTKNRLKKQIWIGEIFTKEASKN